MNKQADQTADSTKTTTPFAGIAADSANSPNAAGNEQYSDNGSEYAEAEPVLAYTRMKNDISNILEKDSVSCIKAGHRIIVLGTHWGIVHILDHDGNKILSKELHGTTVNGVTMDSREDYVASCGDDGRVCLFGLCDAHHDQTVEFNRPIKCVELEPHTSASTLSFCTGDTKLVLSERGFMGRRKTSVLHEAEGLIRQIKWCGDTIAWSNERGVKVYSTSERRIITYITKDHDAELRDELYPCSLLWLDADTLIVCWADRFKICKTVRRSSAAAQLVASAAGAAHQSSTKMSKALSSLAGTMMPGVSGSGLGSMLLPSGAERRDVATHVEIISMVQTDFYICGVAAFRDPGQFLLLCYEKPLESETGDGVVEEDRRPHIRVIQAHPDSFEEISFDAVTINDYAKNKPVDYRLDCIADEGAYFILSPKDLIKAVPRSFDDHIRWLMERCLFEQALDEMRLASSASSETVPASSRATNATASTVTAAAVVTHALTYQTVALNFIDHLLATKQYKEAAEWCSKITLDAKSWEEKILIFAKEGQLVEIFEKIPCSNPTLTPVIYEKVLNEFLKLKNYTVFKYLVKKWPCDIYDLKCITSAVLDAQRKDDARILLESLAILYEYQKLFDKSFVMHITLSDQSVFDFLVKHNLYECAFDNIIQLIGLNKQKAISILIDNVDKLPVKRVVEQLSKNKLYLHYYLDAIFEKDGNLSRDYHTMQVVLYAEYERDKLLRFLQNSQYIILAQAQKELQERNLIPEIVYILERMGQIKKALQLVLHAIKDVDQAIQFCKKHNDKDLWEDLIKYSLNKPEYIIALLNNIGTHVDPVHLIDRIPNSIKIKGLRDALVRILQDYKIQISLLDNSKSIMFGDCLNLMDKQMRVVRKGVCVENTERCLVCESLLYTGNVAMLQRLRVFACKHAYHDECVQPTGSCVVCSQSTSHAQFVMND